MKNGFREDLLVKSAGAATLVLSLFAAVQVLSWWMGSAAAVPLPMRLPVTPAAMAALADTGSPGGPVDIGRHFAAAAVTPSPLGGSWPRFRGRDHDNVAREEIPLAEEWSAGGPPLLWKLELGEGHAGAAVHNGRVYILDYDEEEESDLLRCLSLEGGREIWRRWYRTGAKRNHGVSRTVPAVSEEYVVTVGPKCHAMCVDADTGEFLWGIDLVREYGAREPLWFTAQHPLLDGDIAIFAPGGRALMIAVDSRSGEVLWETPNPRGWQMSHASIVPMTFKGRKTYVYTALGGMAGIAADGDKAGQVLWETDEWNHSVIAPSPVILEGGRIFVTAGYGAGSAIFRLRGTEGGIEVSLEKRFGRKEFACEQQTPIHYRGHLYTVMPKDGGTLRDQFVCMTAEGRHVYGSGKDNRFGLGPFLVADGKVLILDDDGVLTMVRASTEGWYPLARAQVLRGRDAWAPMALAGGRLLVRNSKEMVCLDLRSPAAPTQAGTTLREPGDDS